jgi:predicted GNAT superfamily acetyltransferase
VGHDGPVAPAPTIRPLTLDDAPAVLAINEEIVHHLAPMDEAEYRWFLDVARCAWAAELDGEVAGFVLVLDPGVAYESRNYAWFSERFEAFLYLDRVAVDASVRRAGVGTAIYDAVEAAAAEAGLPVLLEVNVQPVNEPSLAFHTARGYEALGELEHPGAKVTRMFARHP